MSLTRCFIALELPLPVQKHLEGIIFRLMVAQADIKWVEPENTHLTLKFLGEISPKELKSSRKVLLNQDGKRLSIQCRTGQIGAFPSWSRPQVLWLGLQSGIREISTLQQSLENDLAEYGFARGPKKFKPHITLGRVRSLANMDKLSEKIRNLSLEEIEFNFGEIALIKSTLTQSGPVYQPLETIKLS